MKVVCAFYYVAILSFLSLSPMLLSLRMIQLLLEKDKKKQFSDCA
jgi:hypothetical protein